MASALVTVVLLLTVFSQTHTHPLKQLDFELTSEHSWFWGWAWGAENKVSVVDRSPPVSFVSRPASFGAELKQPLLGYVIPLSSYTVPCSSENGTLPSSDDPEPPPNLGCPPLCVSGPHEPDLGDTWIALVQRGECEFVSKVREAQRLGAHAVVVGGDNPDISGNPDTLVNMYNPGDSSDVRIPSTFITYSDYKLLYALIANSDTSHSGIQTLSLLITAEYSAWEWYSPIITFIIILLLPSSLTFITLLIHRVRAARAARLDRAPEDVVNNLPSLIWTGKGWEHHDGHKELAAAAATPAGSDAVVDEENPSTSNSGPTADVDHPWFEQQVECAICLSDFAIGDVVRILPCRHIFHQEEIDEWLIQRKKWCPVCKADVTQSSNVPDPESTEDEAGQHTSPAPSLDPSSATETTPLLHDTDQS